MAQAILDHGQGWLQVIVGLYQSVLSQRVMTIERTINCAPAPAASAPVVDPGGDLS